MYFLRYNTDYDLIDLCFNTLVHYNGIVYFYTGIILIFVLVKKEPKHIDIYLCDLI